MCFASGPGKDIYDSTKIIGKKLYEESMVSNLIKHIYFKYLYKEIN